MKGGRNRRKEVVKNGITSSCIVKGERDSCEKEKKATVSIGYCSDTLQCIYDVRTSSCFTCDHCQGRVAAAVTPLLLSRLLGTTVSSSPNNRVKNVTLFLRANARCRNATTGSIVCRPTLKATNSSVPPGCFNVIMHRGVASFLEREKTSSDSGSISSDVMVVVLVVLQYCSCVVRVR